MTKKTRYDELSIGAAIQGPFAFPFKIEEGQTGNMFFGMTVVDYFAAHAPIGFNDAVQAFGSYPDMRNDRDRTAFMATWALLRYEYADAMLARSDEAP